MSVDSNMSKETFLVNHPVKPAGFNHSFDVGIAVACGIEAALLYNHLTFWLVHNKIQGINQINGKTWTYDTSEAITKYFPYFTPKQIKYALAKLCDAGIIIKAQLSPDKFNKTNWYSLADETVLSYSNNVYDETKLSDRSDKRESSIGQICPMDRTNMSDLHNTDTKLTDTINTSYKVPEEPSASAEKESAKASPKEKPKKRMPEFPADVRDLAAEMIKALMKYNPDYRPPGNLERFLINVNQLLHRDERAAERIMQVLEWALADNVERENFNGWSSVMYSKNPPETLRKHFSKIARQMDAKPKQKDRKFAPSSNDQRAKEIMDEMTRNAL